MPWVHGGAAAKSAGKMHESNEKVKQEGNKHVSKAFCRTLQTHTQESRDRVTAKLPVLVEGRGDMTTIEHRPVLNPVSLSYVLGEYGSHKYMSLHCCSE
jgi:hypothetical protein